MGGSILLGFGTLASPQAGMIASSPANMLTDDDGRLRIGGLPHGNYRWTVESPSGDALTGELTLPPAGVEELRVVVP